MTALAATLVALAIWFVPSGNLHAGLAIATATGAVVFMVMLLRNPANFTAT